MATIDLCTLDDVRKHAQYQDSDTQHDDVIEPLITRMSRAILRRYREFAPATDDESRTVTFDPEEDTRVALVPWDLRAAAAVVIDQGYDTELELTTGQWRLCHHDRLNGVWRGVELDRRYRTRSPFTERTLTVTGSWGFTEIPEDVTESCVLAVISHLRQDVQAFGGALQPNSFGDDVNEAVAFPPGVRGLLEAFRYDLYT